MNKNNNIFKFMENIIGTRLWKRVVGVLGCIVVFCTVYALILPAITATNNNLNAKVTSVQFIDGTGNTSAKYDGSIDKFTAIGKVNYSIPVDEIKVDGSYNKTWVYELPEGVSIPDEQLNNTKPFNDTSKNIHAGTYVYKYDSATGKYYCEIVFDDTYLDTASGTIDGFFTFDAQIDTNKLQEDGSIKVETGDANIVATVPKEDVVIPEGQKSPHYDVDVEKKLLGFTGGKLQYEVSVSSTKGTPSNVILTDTLTSDIVTINTVDNIFIQTSNGGTINLAGNRSNDGWTQEQIDAAIEHVKNTPNSYFYDHTTKIIHMNVPQLGANEEYKVFYSFDVNTGNGVDLNKEYLINNNCKADSEHPTNGEKVTDQDDAGGRTVLALGFLKEVQVDANKNELVWTINLNSVCDDIANEVLSDIMLKDAVEGSLTITPDSGFEKQADGSIKFLPVNGDENRQKYVIEYRTPITDEIGWQKTTVSNTATINHNGQDISVSVSKDFGAGSIDKTQSSSLKIENGIGTMDYTVTLNLPSIAYGKGVLPLNTVVRDELGVGNAGETKGINYMTKEQVTNMVQNITCKWGNQKLDLSPYVKVICDNGYSYSYSNLNNIPENVKIIGWRIETGDNKIDLPSDTSSIEIKYQSTVDVTQLNDQDVIYNKVKVDSYEKETKLPFKDKYLVKEGTSSVTNSDGTVSWTLKVLDQEANTIILEDFIPENMELVGLTSGTSDYYGPKLQYDKDTNIITWETGNFYKYENSGTFYDSSTNTLHVEVRKKDGTSMGDVEYWVTVTCKLTDAFLEQHKDGNIVTLTNNATASSNGNKIGDASHTTEWKYKIETNPNPNPTPDPVDPENPKPQPQNPSKNFAQWLSNSKQINNTIAFVVDINPTGADMNTEGDKIRVLDYLIYQEDGNGASFSIDYETLHLTLNKTTVKLYEIIDENTRVLVNYPDWSWTLHTFNKDQLNEYYALTGVNYCWTDKASVIEAYVPDEKHYVLEYSYDVEVTMREGDESKIAANSDGIPLYIENTAKTESLSSNTQRVQDGIKYKLSNSSAGAVTDKSYLIYKVDMDNFQKPLQGVEFTLYKYDSNSNNYVNTGYKYLSDEYGRITVPTNDPSRPIDQGVGYYLIETQPLEGYLSPDPNARYYFYLSEDQTATIPGVTADLNATNIYYSIGGDYVTNQKKPSTAIKVIKQWFDTETNQPITDVAVTSINFDLYRIASSTVPTEDQLVFDESNKVGTYTITAQDGWTWYSDVLDPYDQSNVNYYYYVKEQSINNYKLLTVENNGINQGTITLTNTPSKEYTLPHTGGSGTHMMTFIGMTLVISTLGMYTLRKKRGMK